MTLELQEPVESFIYAINKRFEQTSNTRKDCLAINFMAKQCTSSRRDTSFMNNHLSWTLFLSPSTGKQAMSRVTKKGQSKFLEIIRVDSFWPSIYLVYSRLLVMKAYLRFYRIWFLQMSVSFTVVTSIALLLNLSSGKASIDTHR